MRLFLALAVISTAFLGSLCVRMSDIVPRFNLYTRNIESQPRHTGHGEEAHSIVLENIVVEETSRPLRQSPGLRITFELPSWLERIKFELDSNNGIIAPSANVQYLDKRGNVRSVEAIDNSDHQTFKGRAFTKGSKGFWSNVGWARVQVKRRGSKPLFEGTFAVGDDVYRIRVQSGPTSGLKQLETPMDDYIVAYRLHGDTHDSRTEPRSQNEPFCSSGRLSRNVRRDGDYWSSSSSGKYEELQSNIGNSSGCPSSRQVAPIGIATDCSYTASFGSSDVARQNVISVVNSASEVFEQDFNVALSIQNITISNAECPSTPRRSTPWNVACSSDDDLNQRLSLFSSWRGSIQDGLAYWSLFTNCTSGSQIGVSWIGQLCNSGDPGNNMEQEAGANVISRNSEEWQVFA